MLKETDLEKVKSIARMLLLTPIHKTPYSPVVVQHPFTSSGIAAAKKDGALQIIDITESEENLVRWQDWMREWIINAKSAYEIYMMTNKPYGLTYLKYAEPYLSKEDFSKILGDAWVRSENPNGDANVSKRELLSMFKQADKKVLMTEEDYKRWESLDDTLTVYRGVTSHNAKNIKALSWTLDEKTAEWFAHRFDENGTVYQAQINKKDVCAYFGERCESEVVVDPKGLMDIAETETMIQGLAQTI